MTPSQKRAVNTAAFARWDTRDRCLNSQATVEHEIVSALRRRHGLGMTDRGKGYRVTWFQSSGLKVAPALGVVTRIGNGELVSGAACSAERMVRSPGYEEGSSLEIHNPGILITGGSSVHLPHKRTRGEEHHPTHRSHLCRR